MDGYRFGMNGAIKKIYALGINNSILKLANNAISMAFGKGVDMVSQLLVMPHIIALYGIKIYGEISFYVAVMQYLTIFCDFGFNFNATKRIADSKSEKEMSKIFLSVIFSKTIIMIIINIALLLIFVMIPNFNYCLYISLSLFVILTSYNIDWLFLGKQNMAIPAFLKLIVRIIYVPTILFAFSKNTNYEYVIIMDCCIPIINIFTILYAIVFYNIKFHKVNFCYINEIFRESWLLFSSTLFISFYRNINVVVLKFFAGEYYVGIYAAVEKLSRACQAVIEPMTTALFPFVAIQSKGEESTKILIIKKLTIVYVIILSVIIPILISLSDTILYTCNIGGQDATINFYIMLFPFFFGCLNYLLGYVGLVNLNMSSQFRNSVLLVGLIAIPLTIILSYLFYNIGAAISVALSELLLCIILFSNLKKVIR